MANAHIKVLLIEDDEDDYIIFKRLLSGISQKRFELKWAANYEAAVKAAGEGPFDVVFIDYVLGQDDGLTLMRELFRDGLKAPVIILTGLGDFEIDDQAMREGASDYLEKKNLTPSLLERAIRYAMERARNLAKIQAQGDQLKFLSEKLLEIGEKERGFIAGELHDGIKSQLCAIKYALEEKLLRMGGKEVEEIGIPLEKIVSWTKDTLSETGRICTELRSEILDDLGILDAVRWTCRQFKDAYSDTQLHLRLDLEENSIPQSLKLVIYRIVQEALNNAAKHSNAENVRISLETVPDGLSLVIVDDGKGFDMEDPEFHKGLGLESMQNRTEIVSGRFSLESTPGGGTRIECLWPSH